MWYSPFSDFEKFTSDYLPISHKAVIMVSQYLKINKNILTKLTKIKCQNFLRGEEEKKIKQNRTVHTKCERNFIIHKSARKRMYKTNDLLEESLLRNLAQRWELTFISKINFKNFTVEWFTARVFLHRGGNNKRWQLVEWNP